MKILAGKNEQYLDYTLDEEIIPISTITLTRLIQLSSECVSLYMFYIHHAKRQKTVKPWITDSFARKGLKWGKDKFYKTKKLLEENNFINQFQVSKKGVFEKTFIQINFTLSEKSIANLSNNFVVSNDNSTTEKSGMKPMSGNKDSAEFSEVAPVSGNKDSGKPPENNDFKPMSGNKDTVKNPENKGIESMSSFPVDGNKDTNTCNIKKDISAFNNAPKNKIKYSKEFEEGFWKYWEVKEDKARAYKNFNCRLEEGYTVDFLRKCGINYQDLKKKKGQFPKMAKTFLDEDKVFLEFKEPVEIRKDNSKSFKNVDSRPIPKEFRPEEGKRKLPIEPNEISEKRMNLWRVINA